MARIISSFLIAIFLLVGAQQSALAASRKTWFSVPPSITTQPAGQTVTAGKAATFSVAVSGTAPFSYQWRKNGIAVRGATSSSYTTPATSTTNSGALYSVVVGNSAGRVTSSAAMLTVVAAPVVKSPTPTTSGTGTSAPPPVATATLVLSPSSLSFGNVTLNSSNTLAATLTNAGTASASITNVIISGAGFSVSGAPVGQTLAPSQSVTLSIVFAPSSAGSVTGSVTVASNASNPSVTVNFSGTGVQAPVSHSTSLTWSPSSTSVAGYRIYRSAVSGGSYVLLNSSLLTITTYVDNGVQGGSTYYYVATAVDGNNAESPYSNEISALVP